MAQVKETRKAVGDLLVLLVHKLPANRISTLSAAVIQVYGESAQAYAAFAAALAKKGDRETAIAAFKHALGLEPRLVWANEELGKLLIHSDPVAAVEYFKAALAVQPDSLDAHVFLAFALIALRRFDEAIASATTAIELQAKEPLAWLARSRAKADKGDLSSAQEDLNRALEVDPQNELAHSLRIALGER
jgi:tetratricopeptide (TPR) repeat protein